MNDDDRARTEAERREREEDRLPPAARVRDDDLEPFGALRYIARLFKILAVILVILIVAEIVLGLVQAGTGALVGLLVSSTRLLVFAGLLWGAGDIALMLIETNHDLRATRILVARLNGQLDRIAGGGAAGPGRTGGPGGGGTGGTAGTGGTGATGGAGGAGGAAGAAGARQPPEMR